MQSAETRTPTETATEADLSAAHGTPKKGIECNKCDDWGTVVIQRGGTLYEEICPIADCKAAARVREQRGES